MKHLRNLLLFLILTFLVSISPPRSVIIAEFHRLASANNPPVVIDSAPEATLLPDIPEVGELASTPEPVEIVPTPTATPSIYAALYNCQMELRFTSGPLDGRDTHFTVLGRDYFYDKGDQFDLGKGTSVYYEEQRYFILHSSYLNDPLPQPMEAEFLRRFLENWGNHGPMHIQAKIDELIGSQAVWICDGEQVFHTEITGIARLSHEASNRLWLSPWELTSIIEDREGVQSEWIGDIPLTDNETIFLAFCGWGPPTITSGRFVYYRYLISFEVLP